MDEQEPGRRADSATERVRTLRALLRGARDASVPRQPSLAPGETPARALERGLGGRFTQLEALGRGDHVFLARDRGADANVVLRVLPPGVMPNRDDLEAWKEAGLAGLQGLREVLDGPDLRLVVLDHVPGRSLASVLAKQPTVPSERLGELLMATLGVLQGIHAHFPPMLHLDVRPDSIVLDAWDQVTLLLPAIPGGLEQPRQPADALAYEAPECRYGRRSPASDLWSLGLTMAQAATGLAPAQLYDAELAVVDLSGVRDEGLRQALSLMVAVPLSRRAASCQAILDVLTGAAPGPAIAGTGALTGPVQPPAASRGSASPRHSGAFSASHDPLAGFMVVGSGQAVPAARRPVVPRRAPSTGPLPSHEVPTDTLAELAQALADEGSAYLPQLGPPELPAAPAVELTTLPSLEPTPRLFTDLSPVPPAEDATPFAVESATTVGAGDQVIGAPHEVGATILVVEDDETISYTLRYILQREGYTVHTLGDGREAIAAVNGDAPPNLILLDLLLPFADGFQVIEAVRRRPGWARTPIVVLTASSQEQDIARALSQGATDVIVKPFQVVELLARVGRLVGTRT